MSQSGNKFGAFKGVFVPSILTILGVILFLRLGWVVGQAGLVTTILIISLSSLITLITALSISSAATNADVGPGGSYFLISRCFGLEPGAAIGLPLYLAQALGISFYVVGFAESLQLFFPTLQVTWVAFGTLVVLTFLTFKSSSLVLKTQIFILIVIAAALLSFAFGASYEVAPLELEALSFEKVGFWAVFAVFFPAVTGIEAGISMSGDLKDPRKALPVGTIAAVIVGFIAYVFFAYKFFVSAPPEILVSNSLLMTELAVFGLIIYIGLWGATISSSMGALLGAPRTMQALAKDRILPRILARGSAEANEPQIATLVSFCVAAAGLFIGDLNAIASILSMFFLTSYGALNLVSGLEGLIGNPSWRPSFKTPWLVSIIGAFLCFGAMLMIDSGASLLSLILVVGVYFIMKKRQMRSRYSDIRGGLVMHFARELIYKYETVKSDERNWRPNFLIFSGSPKSRLHLIDLAYTMSLKRGFLTVASVVSDNSYDLRKLSALEDAAKEYLEKKKISALLKMTTAKSFSDGAVSLLRNYGLGRVTPNTIVLGDSTTADDGYMKVIDEVVREKKNLLIVRSSESNEADVFLRGSSIDVWWRGQEGNVGLMLTLAYMLQTSRKWQMATLTFKSIVNSENEKLGVQKNMEQFLSKSRITADVKVFVSAGEPYAQIVDCSKDTDLVFLGLKKPEELSAYKLYYDEIMSKTESLENSIYVIKGEETEFNKIFN